MCRGIREISKIHIQFHLMYQLINSGEDQVKPAKTIHNEKGFTLIELIITMAVFLVVIIIAAQTFNTVVTESAKLSKSEESNIEGVIGLEVMRHDLEQTGFGLFWGLLPGSSVPYNEADTTNWSADTTNYAKMNDNAASPPVPRAFVGFDAFADDGSNLLGDFIGVKGSTVGRNKAAQLWNYIPYQNYSTASGRESRPVAWPTNNLAAGDKVIAIRSNFNNPDDDHLLVDSAGTFTFNYNTNGSINSDFLPTDSLQTYMIYGIERGSTALRMPFNRTDFFVRIPSAATTGDTAMPAFCAPGTGTLYKATVNHSNGKYNYIPLLDCVANMQVVLGWSFNSGAEKMQDAVHAYSSMPDKSTYTVSTSSATASALPVTAADDIKSWLQDPTGIREHLKLIKVYLLVQEGKKDSGYTYPASSVVVGDLATLTQQYNFTAEQLKYRWRLYRIIVRPKNLVSNQR
jgi:prepilin-type N-terminal cleavage/methylation domain-containing protein